jgi:hypothetical protein
MYLSTPNALWPDHTLSPRTEIERYESEFKRLKGQFADVDFVGNEVVTHIEQAQNIAGKLSDVDGILAIHLSIGVADLLGEILKSFRPTVLFASPSSSREWAKLEPLCKEDGGALLEFILTSDLSQLAAAIRPFRAIHHLREAKIVNISTRAPSESYVRAVRTKFGTEIVTLGLESVMEAYDSVSAEEAEDEMEQWVSEAESVREPPRDEILRSCRLALAFEKLLDDVQATVLTVDCLESMYHQLPAFPCMGFVRLSNVGLGGICESDLDGAITHIALQGLSGKPGFISNPAGVEQVRGTLSAHCMGSMKMDGPGHEAAPYALRAIPGRHEGCVPQVRMRLGQRVTQARLVDQESVLYFTGRIVDMPDLDSGCRSRITLEIDGDVAKLRQTWMQGLRRTTVYGDLTQDLKRLCRFKELKLVNEA